MKKIGLNFIINLSFLDGICVKLKILNASVARLKKFAERRISIKVKIFDFEHEGDLEEAINDFLLGEYKIHDIKYQISHFFAQGEQIYSFSALIIYEE